FVLYSLLRVFMNCFWGETTLSDEDKIPLRKGLIIPSIILTIISFGIGLGAESISHYVIDAARTLANPEVYIDAVLQQKRSEERRVGKECRYRWRTEL